jgi:hypothetical protein
MHTNNSTAAVWFHALGYVAEYGLAVLPLRPGMKVPACVHGVKDASTNLEQLDTWAATWPGANLGIAGGGTARMVVLDFDAPDAVGVLTTTYGPRPATWTATTPRGGRHEYYVCPADVVLGNTVAKLAPHVDTRATHGYVVAPPSTLADGRGYTWVPGHAPWDVDRADLPAPLLEALREPHRPAPRAVVRPRRTGATPEVRVGRYLAALPPLADGMGRNLTAFRLAAFVLHDVTGTPADALVALEVWNAKNVEPLEADALDRAVANAARYGGRHAA